jgi:hypothetical protein
MKIWLAERAHYPIIGAWLTFPATAHVVAWGGLFLDLLVVPALLVRRTRVFAFIAATAFHVANAVMFGIGTFPWFSIVATTLFFTPESFRRIPSFDRLLPVRGTPEARSYPVSAARTALLALYVTVQCLVPLRHFLYPGPAAWTEEGRTFAWQMMLRDKRGSVAFEVRDPRSAERWVEDPAEYLTEWQRRTLVGNPDLILQFAHRLAADYAERGHPDVEVRARTEVSLNGRPARPIVDPRIDLAREPRRLTHYPWIEPLVDAGRAE